MRLVLDSHKNIIKKRVFENFILFFVCMFIFAEFSGTFNALKNIGIYVSFVFMIFFMIFYKNDAFLNFKNNIKTNRILICLTCLLVLVIFLFSLYPYDKEFSSISIAFKENKKALMLLAIILFCFNQENTKYGKAIFYTLCFSFVFCMLYFAKDLMYLNVENTKKYITAVIDRNFATYFDTLYAFNFVAFFIFKDIKAKISFALVLVVAICLDILTSARGSWLAFLITTFIGGVLLFIKDMLSKKILAFMFFTGFVVALFSYIAYQNLPIVKHKFHQTTTSGRDVILKNRLPLLFQSDRAYIGLGYGFYQYHKFLNDKQKEKKLSTAYLGSNGGLDKQTNLIRYYRDEPTFIANYYHFGISALIIPIFVFYVIIKSFLLYLKQNNYLMLSLGMSVTSLYLIRGLFEGYGVITLFLFASIFICFNYKEGVQT